MIGMPQELEPPARLALVYAPKSVRTAFELVLQFDARCAGIAAVAGEPLIAQMKLAWWRDAVGAEPSARPKGEPMMAALTAIGDPSLDRTIAALMDAWEVLIVSDEWTVPVIDRFAQDRGSTIFGFFTHHAALPKFPIVAAKQWAIDDLRLRFGNKLPNGVFATVGLPSNRSFRSLTILAMSVRNISGARLIWHALTGH
jgi:15-cis-phytoene synthase